MLEIKKEIVGILHTNAINTISILAFITDICNYNCYYCYNNKPRQNKFLDLNILYKFIISLYNYRKQDIYVELIGGETLLHKDAITLISKLYQFYPHIKIGIYSNFSLDLNTYLKILQNNVYLTLTWHSIQKDNYNIDFINKIYQIPDIYFNTIAESHIMYENKYIKLSLNAYNKIRSKCKNSTELCLLDRDFNTDKIYFCENLYYTKLQILNYNNLQKDIEEKRKFFTIIYKDKTTQNISLSMASDTPILYNYKHWLCDAGLNNLYIDLDGNIFPCLHYAGKEHYKKLGNIYINTNARTIKYARTFCETDRCSCSWEVNKKKIFLNK